MARRIRFITKPALKRLLVLAALLVVAGIVSYVVMIRMPGRSHAGPLPPVDDVTTALATALARDVTTLAEEIGPRNRWSPAAYAKAADMIDARLASVGYVVSREASSPTNANATPGNIVAERRGTDAAAGIVIVGAHYDSYADSPGANDNASGTAVVLALAERMRDVAPKSTLRFVLFADEEPPQFQTDEMGSLTYARGCAARGETIAAMFSVETVGYYSDEPNSQDYPKPLNALYPATGNFVGFVGNVASRALLHRVIKSFRDTTPFPSEGGALPSGIPGVNWSDHWAFWQIGAPALMITDTAPFRYPHYHTPEDTPDKLDFERMARITIGLERVLRAVVDAK